MYKEIVKWLRIQHMLVAENHLRLRLESHPDYPSLLAVKDTLDELGIESYACQGTKEGLKNEGKPFLAHFNMGEGNVLFFKDVAGAEQKIKDFDKYWSGNVMFADPVKNYGNLPDAGQAGTEHDKLYKNEKLNDAFGIAAVILFAGALSGLSIAAGSMPAILLTVSNFIGLCFSWLIAQKEFGISNSVSDKICSMAKHSRCESVLFSKGAKLFNWLTWGDVGMVYFTASLFYVLYLLITGNSSGLQLFYLISISGLLFPFFSLYYRWKVGKQWCMLCIAVLIILSVIGIISAANFNNHLSGGNFLYFLLIIALATWQLLKLPYQKNK
jgi:uncharacterized membrane protein